MAKIKHSYTGVIHKATLNPKLKGRHYKFLCGGWCDLNSLDNYELTESEKVTCTRCLSKMGTEKSGHLLIGLDGW